MYVCMYDMLYESITENKNSPWKFKGSFIPMTLVQAHAQTQ